MKYIKEYNGNIPIILQGRRIAEIGEFGEFNKWASLYDSKDQFQYNKIIENEGHKHGYNGRLRKFKFGRGILLTMANRLCAVFCEGNKVVVNNDWYDGYSSEFARFRKMLKENGYNIRKDIIYTNDINEFYYDPIKPNMNDYDENFQKQLSEEFILSQRPAIISSVEENITGETNSNSPYFWPELLEEIALREANLNDFNVMTQAC